MDPTEVRAACLLDGTVTTARLIPALQAAMLTVNCELQAWATEQRTRWGYAALADVPAPQVGGESAQVLRYRRAVHACLQADLAEANRVQDTLPAGMGKEARVLESLQVQIDEHRRRQRPSGQIAQQHQGVGSGRGHLGRRHAGRQQQF